ncbi:MAG: YkvA family protein [Anaeromyxobacteraceae bacterium]
MRILVALAAALAATWLGLVAALLVARPRGPLLTEALRLLPDTLRLLRNLAVDRELPRGARVALWLLFAYLAMPFDLIPDFIPVLGYADDAILAVLVLRSVVRRAGPAAIRRNWPGSEDGLAALARAAGLALRDRA